MTQQPRINVPAGIPEDVSKAIVGAYYPKVLGLPEAARTRAQAAFTLSSAIATSLLAFGLFAELEDFPTNVQVLAVAAIFTWVCAAAAYIWAVAAKVGPAQELKSTDSSTQFANQVLTAAVKERNTVDNRQAVAHILSAVAAAVTILALILALREGKNESAAASMTITLTESAQMIVASGCDQTPGELIGTVDEESLDDQIVSITLDAGVCHDRATTFLLPKEGIVSIVSR